MMKKLLHAGCGSKLNKVPHEFGAMKEVRLDLNPQVAPDIIASIVAMPMVEDESFDAVFCSHCLEHLYAFEVAMALREFARVLKSGGMLRIHVPDLQSIGGKIALDEIDSILYPSLIGFITPLDMLYGHQGSVGSGNLYMQHRTGFTQSLLKRRLEDAGFGKIDIDRETKFELVAHAFKSEAEDESFPAIAPAVEAMVG